jgi:eukaryotic-like serine/threonine-protein kinase
MPNPSKNWESVKALFESALEQDASRRSSFLEKHCSDPTLRAEVERLLAEHEKAGAFLSSPVLAHLAGNDEPPTEGLAEGEVLAGRFRIVRYIASGGMGEVYEAEDQELRERVAIKVIRPEILAQPNAIARFKREVHLARKVTHSNVCRIFDLFRDKRQVGNVTEETVFISMELLNGQTLAAHLEKAGPMGETDSLPLIRQMASALTAAHAAGVVHRDFKPGNVVLVQAAFEAAIRPVVTDFGLAAQSLLPDDAASLSTHGILGTPAYMSPEQLEGRPATAASDIYAFGLVIYEMVTGARPFQGDTPASAALKRLSEPPTPPRQFQPGLSTAWERGILRCLERDPAKRLSNADEVVKAISNESFAKTSGATFRKRIVWQAAAVLLALLIVGFGVGYSVHRARTKNLSASRVTNASFHPRRSVAVLGFKNLSGKPEASYLSTALSEMTTSTLAAGGQLRAIPGETVSNMKISLALPDADSYGAKTLDKIRRNLGCDDIVVGAYLVEVDGRVRVDLNLEDALTGELVDSVTVDGTEAQIDDLVTRAGTSLRSKLGAGELPPAQAAEVKATLPSDLQAARLYSEGLAKMRAFENVAARDLLQKAVAVEPTFPLSHVALAKAWKILGYDVKSRDEARQAFDLSSALGKEDRLWVEARYRIATHDWDKAVNIYKGLFQSRPDNIEYGLALASAQSLSGKPKDALDTLETLRKLPSPAGEDPRIPLEESIADYYLSDYKRMQVTATRAADRARSEGATLVMAVALANQCSALERLGDAKGAIAACNEAERADIVAGDRNAVANEINTVANISFDLGNLAEARSKYEEAVSIFREIGCQGGAAMSSANVGVILASTGDLRGSVKMFEQALAIQLEIGDKSHAGNQLANIGSVLAQLGNLRDAQAKFHEALILGRDIGDKDMQALALANLGQAAYYQGHFDTSGDFLNEAEPILRGTGRNSLLCTLLTMRGEASLMRADMKSSRDNYEEAQGLGNKTGDKQCLSLAQIGLANLAIQESRPSDAEAPSRQAIAELHAEEDTDNEILAHAALAYALLKMGRTEDAKKEITDTEPLLSKSQNVISRWEISLVATRIEARLGNAPAAKTKLRSVLEEAVKDGFKSYEFKTGLALGEVEIKSGEAKAGRVRLAALEKDTTDKGFLLIAHQAAAGREGQLEQ